MNEEEPLTPVATLYDGPRRTNHANLTAYEIKLWSALAVALIMLALTAPRVFNDDCTPTKSMTIMHDGHKMVAYSQGGITHHPDCNCEGGQP